MSKGYFMIGDFENKTIIKCTSHKFLELIEYGKTMQCQFIPQLTQGDFLVGES